MYLVRVGEVRESDIPALALPKHEESQPSSELPPGVSLAPHLAVGNIASSSKGDPSLGQEDQRHCAMPSYQQNFFENRGEKRSLEESENLDLNAGIHGNWTLSNAKSRLHQYLQVNRLPAEYKYSSVGQDHNRVKFLMAFAL
jgi:ATP-dependent RNA helicase A